ncbi:MAG: hypothetical protein ACRDPA_26665 [Solirubrobacteraceae bacterium]
MSSGEFSRERPRCLRVLPRSRGSWIVATEQGDVLSEHATANEAEAAALACLREGEELLVFDRYHRCHQRARPHAPQSSQRSLITRLG